MPGKLAIAQGNGLQELRETAHQPKNRVVRFFAALISYVFHPIFIPFYIIWFLMVFQPQFFAGFPPQERAITLVRFLLMYSFFPLVTVLLAKGLGFLDSIYLKTQRDRIIPYIACGIFYFWMAYVLRHQPQFAKEIIQLSLSIFIASSIGLLFNIYMKISLHAISMGIMLVFTGMLAAEQVTNFTIYFSIALLIAGLVCTARFIVSDHTQREIYLGLLVGGVSQFLGVWADGILP